MAVSPGYPVDPLAEQVRVPVVPGVLLDHVLVDLAQRRRLRGRGNQVIQTAAKHGGPRPFDAGPVDRQVLIGPWNHDSTSAMCRTRPSSDSGEGGHDRVTSCSGVSPAHLISKVVR